MLTAKEIMVVDRDLLLAERCFQGFLPAEAYDYESLILQRCRYAPRADAEGDVSIKQPIAYCVIVNPLEKKFFVYRRSERKEDYDEERLRGKWSVGIGGHIDRSDFNSANPIRASMLRELDEEVFWEGSPAPAILGYINDDADLVGKVHFGLLYRIETRSGVIRPRAREIAEGRMVSAAEWMEMLEDPSRVTEGWTRIASIPIMEILA